MQRLFGAKKRRGQIKRIWHIYKNTDPAFHTSLTSHDHNLLSKTICAQEFFVVFFLLRRKNIGLFYEPHVEYFDANTNMRRGQRQRLSFQRAGSLSAQSGSQ